MGQRPILVTTAGLVSVASSIGPTDKHYTAERNSSVAILSVRHSPDQWHDSHGEYHLEAICTAAFGSGERPASTAKRSPIAISLNRDVLDFTSLLQASQHFRCQRADSAARIAPLVE